MAHRKYEAIYQISGPLAENLMEKVWRERLSEAHTAMVKYLHKAAAQDGYMVMGETFKTHRPKKIGDVWVLKMSVQVRMIKAVQQSDKRRAARQAAKASKASKVDRSQSQGSDQADQAATA